MMECAANFVLPFKSAIRSEIKASSREDADASCLGVRHDLEQKGHNILLEYHKDHDWPNDESEPRCLSR